jgi:hypothetical protein
VRLPDEPHERGPAGRHLDLVKSVGGGTAGLEAGHGAGLRYPVVATGFFGLAALPTTGRYAEIAFGKGLKSGRYRT